ncbi:capsule biosynthesis protein [Phreatobacter sp.]|uniref:capsule biosynthesis protein n=1 Tax=Phreatobacter sp. TaxID=1966341 RepID=UPI003F72EB54
MQLAFDTRDVTRQSDVPAAARSRRPFLVALPRRLISLLVFLLALSPTLTASVYYGFVATDRYVSEAQFVIRSASRTTGTTGFTAFLQMVGISGSQDDTFAVHDFISSRDAMLKLMERMPLREMYGKPDADALSVFPNLFYGDTLEYFHRYLKWRIDVSHNSNTGISTLKVQAFSPEDARRIADALLDLSEQLINQMNVRIRQDSVRFATDEVRRGEERMVAAQLTITNFRNREVTLDPTRSSVHVMELVARLAGELSTANALIAEVRASSPSSPQLPSLQRRADAIREQMALERARISNSSDGLAEKIAQFEQLTLEREFASRALGAAIVALDTARSEARRQQLYLERVAGPSVPDQALEPQRGFLIATIFVLNLIALMIVWLFVAGMRLHAPVRDL